LVTGGEDLGVEAGVRADADDEDLEQEADESVGEGARHEEEASWSRRPGSFPVATAT
jgi:hypothetical protein